MGKEGESDDQTAPGGGGGGGGGGQGRRAKASTGPKIQGAGAKLSIGGDSFVKRTENPEWLRARVAEYDAIRARRQAELEAKRPVPVKVTMPDGSVLERSKDGTPYMAWRTTPYDVAATISQGLADAAQVARVSYSGFVDDYDLSEDGMDGVDTLMDAMADLNLGLDDGDDTRQGESKAASEHVMLWDMTRPLVGDVSKLELLKFENDRDAKTVFWHSSAHIMGEALEHLFGCKLTIGPPLAGGFYYDSYMGTGEALREEDCTSRLRLFCWSSPPCRCLKYAGSLLIPIFRTRDLETILTYLRAPPCFLP